MIIIIIIKIVKVIIIIIISLMKVSGTNSECNQELIVWWNSLRNKTK